MDSVISFLAGRAQKETQEEKTYGESNCHGRVFRKELLYSRLTHYKEVWEAAVESRWCTKETLKKRSICCGRDKGTIVGHLPHKVSRVCSLFLQRGSTVTGCRKYSADLAQGRLEVLALFLSRQCRNL